MALITPAYHVAVVVKDLDRAMEELGAILGVSWHVPFGGEGYQLLHGVQVPVTSRVTYSTAGPPYLELLQQCPGSIWETTGLHHIGVWVDDWRAESARLVAAGLPVESVGVDANGEWTAGCYHSTADGLRLELVDIGRSGPKLARYLNGGSYS